MPAGTMNSQTFLPVMKADIGELALEIGKERPLIYPKVVKTGTLPYNNFVRQQMAGMGTLHDKNEGEAFDIDRPIMGGRQTITGRGFGLMTELTFEGDRDEKYGAFLEFMGDAFRAARNKKETRAHEILNDATTGTTYTGFDGLPLGSLVHTRLDGGPTQSNTTAVGFSKTAIAAMRLSFARLKNVGRGWPDVVHPTTFILAPLNVYAAREVLGSSAVPYSTDNEINANIVEGWGWVEDPYITTETDWFARAQDHDVHYEMLTDTMTDSWEDKPTMTTLTSIYQADATYFGSWVGWYIGH